MGFSKAIGQAIFQQLAPEMYSAASMIKTARALGGTYRRKEMLADIRQYQGRAKYETSIRNLAGNKVVPRAWMVPAQLNEPGANYRIFGKAQVNDLRTGIAQEMDFSFYHTDMLKKDDYGREFAESFAEDSIPLDMEFLSFDVTVVEHNIGKPY